MADAYEALGFGIQQHQYLLNCSESPVEPTDYVFIFVVNRSESRFFISRLEMNQDTYYYLEDRNNGQQFSYSVLDMTFRRLWRFVSIQFQ